MIKFKGVLCVLIASLFVAAWGSSSVIAELTIARNGKSTFTIVVPTKRPASVTLASQELQQDIAKATGAKLSIKQDTEQIAKPFISLGFTVQAKAEGITAEKIPDDGFRIVTKNGNLYIIGLDTAAKQPRTRSERLQSKLTPDPNVTGPQYTKTGGWSNGTANGVYAFLEKRLGVRWLMPGELGLVVPAKSTFSIPELDRSESPVFSLRDMSFIMNGKDSNDNTYEWTLHQKLGNSFGMYRENMDHSWYKLIPPSLYEKHPEWFAMIDGERVVPKGRIYKIETTNQEVIEHIANEAVTALKKDPQLRIFSISPNDLYLGWSQSPESKALYDMQAPTVGDLPSVTPLILKYYRDVAAIVQKKYPQGKLAGFLYNTYRYPSTSGDISLPDNFIPILAPDRDYFYGLYREDTRNELTYMLSTWAKVAPPDWFMYDEPNILYWVNESGVITPPATDILNFYFPLLVKNHMKGMTTSGSFVWGQTALKNYLLAKLLWDPALDANKVMQDWLSHAYGAQAGIIMNKFYKNVDSWYAANWAHHRITASDMKTIYGGSHYPQLETLFLQAKAQPMTEAQKRRFHLIESNMVVLQWRLSKAGYLPDGFVSKLQRSTAQIDQLFFEDFKTRSVEDKSFDLLPESWRSGMPSRHAMKVILNNTPTNLNKEEIQTYNKGFIQLYAPTDGTITVRFDSIEAGSAITAYSFFPGADRSNVKRGICDTGSAVTLNVKADTFYLLNIVAYGQHEAKVKYAVTIPNATIATGTSIGSRLYLEGKQEAPLYVYVLGQELNLKEVATGVSVNTK